MTDFYSVILAATGNEYENDFNSTFNRFEVKVNNEFLSDLSVFQNSGTLGTLIVLSSSQRLTMDGRFNFERSLKHFLENPTRGALCTLGMAISNIPSGVPIVVSSIHGYMKEGLKDFVTAMVSSEAEAGIITFKSNSDKYSYLRIIDGKILEISEKVIISNDATAGIFYFKNRDYILNALEWALLNNIKTSGTYYVAPSLNYFVTNNMRILPWFVSESEYIRFSSEDEARQMIEKMRKGD